MVRTSQSWDMHPARWLEAAFGSESRIRILRLLAQDPLKLRSEREIAATIGMSPNAVNKAVGSLRDAGLVTVDKVGSANAVRVLASDALLHVLRTVFQTERELLDELIGIIESTLPKGAACYLYGSSIKGTQHGKSDIDLLIIAKDRETASDVAYAIELKVHRSLPSNLHVIAIGAAEARRRMRKPGGVIKAAVEQGRLLGATRIEEVVRA